MGVVVLHIVALHRFGSNNPLGIDVRGDQDTVSFHPYYTVKDMFGLSVFLTIMAAVVFFLPNSMGHPDNYIPANPMVTPAHIVPEWYFLPFYAILRAVPDKLLGVLAMFAAIAVLFVLPWLDRSPVRSATFRPIYKIMFWVFLLDCGIDLLGCQASRRYLRGSLKACTVYYFAHFIILLPALSVFETPRSLPRSIGKSVLGGGNGIPAPAPAAAREKP